MGKTESAGLDPAGEYSPKEVASLLGVGVQRVYKWIESGRLPHRRLSPFGKKYRLPKSKIDEMVAATQQYVGGQA